MSRDAALIINDEPGRLAALDEYRMLDTPAQHQFDEIVEAAATICGTAYATLTLVDEDRQWFKARIGLDIQETPRVIAFCAHTIRQAEPLMVPDTRADPRFEDNPLVVGPPFVRFYCGVPLVNAKGYAVGTLAVMDGEKRTLDPMQLSALKVLAGLAMEQLEAARTLSRLAAASPKGEHADAELREIRRTLEVAMARHGQQLGEARAAHVEATQLYRALWETTTDAVLITAADGSILYANPRTAVVFGYPPEALVGRHLSLLHPARADESDEEWVHRYLDPARRSLDWRPAETPCLRADGSEVAVEIAFSEIVNQRQRRFIGFFRDVSERARHEADLRDLISNLEQSRARLAEAQAVAKIGSWDTDLRTMALAWSDETFRIFDIEPGQFLGTHHAFLELVHPDDRAAVDAAFVVSRASPAHVEHEVEHRRLTPRGELKLVQERWRNFFDADGRPERAVGTVQDITERKAEQDRIVRLGRMHEVLSGVSQLIVRATDRHELLDGLCRVTAEHGLFDAAWIDVHDADAGRIFPVTLEGADARHVVPRSRVAEADAGGSLGLAARALLRGTAALSNDLVGSTGSGRDAAVELGYRSGIALPLTENGAIIGALSLLSRQPGFFDKAEVRLLDELAADVSLALDRLSKLDQIRFLANYDVLTGLPNRALFVERLGPMLARTDRQSLGAVVQMDLQRLREINNSFGRHNGDELLKRVAQRLRESLGEKSPLGRVHGDHFVFVLSGIRDSKELAHAVELVLDDCFGRPFLFGDQELRVNAKAGVAAFPQDGDEAETLLRNAESALQKAKVGAARFLFYAPHMNAQVAASLLLESRLRSALDNHQFVLHYQPKFDSTTGEITGVEGLIRWNDPESGLVPPLEIIPLLERSGLILEVGEWVLNQAVHDYQRWSELVPNPPRVAVNVSSLQLHQHDFVDMVRRGLARCGSAQHGIDLEITESVLMNHVEDNIDKLEQIRRMGVRVAIDDFGTGYSSLLYLARLPLDTLKVDRSFIISMAEQEGDRAIVSTIVSLAHQLGLSVVAEGVDDHGQVLLLDAMHCDEMQGFLFSKPLPAPAIDSLLKRRAGFSIN